MVPHGRVYATRVQFPAFLFGDEQSVVDAAEAAGLAWADTYRRTRAFAPEALRTVSPNELIIIHDGTLDPFTPRWRLFGAAFAIYAGEAALESADREGFSAAARTTPWGALAMCIRQRPPNTVAAMTQRVRALMTVWSELATLRYVGASKRMPSVIQFPEPEQPSISLDALVNQLFAGPLTLWGPQLGPAKARLELALDAMAAASPADVRAKLTVHVQKMARENFRTKDTPAADPRRVADAIAALSDAELAELVPGVTGDLLSVIYDILRGLEART